MNDFSLLGSMIALKTWGDQIPVSDVTLWRWRKKGWLNPVNICGKLYLTRADIEEFQRRAIAGEFSEGPCGAALKSAARKGCAPENGGTQ